MGAVCGKDSTASPTPLLLNAAFVFVKPHANTPATQDLVRETLQAQKITIVSEMEITGEEIDQKKLIDQHYYAIASKATILPAKDIPVPKDKFLDAFGESWDQVLQDDRAVNALEACQRFDCTAQELNEAWSAAKQTEKFGGGFYCAKISCKGKAELYVFNAFFMTMRSKFVGPGTSIHAYVVQWSPSDLSWSDFRNKVLGPTDPVDGPDGSIRKAILDRYQELGLTSVPDKGDNGVHASASPFEGLTEKLNWIGMKLSDDAFGKALLDGGIPEATIKEWSVDPRVKILPDGSIGSVFDALEDLDVDDCKAKLLELYKLNS